MAWTPVQNPTPAQAVAGSVAKTFASSTPAGNIVYVFITQQFGAVAPKAIASVRDDVDVGVDYTLIKTNVPGSGNCRVDVYAKVATSAGTRQVTVSFSGGSAEATLHVVEGNDTYTIADATNGATGTGTSAQPGSVTPSATALYLGVMTQPNGTATLTQDAAFTLLQEIESSSTAAPINTHYFEGSGAQNPTTTLSASLEWAASIVTFVAALPTISAQPTDQTVEEGATATFNTTVSGATSYQWEKLAQDGAGGWTNIVGATSEDYTTPATTRATDAGTLYRLKATNANGTTTSSAALLRVTATAAASGNGLVVGAQYVGDGYVGAPEATAGGGITANLSVTDENDTLASAATLAIAANGNHTEQDDSLASAASLAITASAAQTDQDDSLTSAGAVAIAANGAHTEDDDSIAADATMGAAGGITANGDHTEEDDTLLAEARLAIAAVLDVVEDGDSLIATLQTLPDAPAEEAPRYGGGGRRRARWGDSEEDIQHVRDYYDALEKLRRQRQAPPDAGRPEPAPEVIVPAPEPTPAAVVEAPRKPFARRAEPETAPTPAMNHAQLIALVLAIDELDD